MEFAFISVDGRGVTRATQKTVVRSRCMRGANKKADSRRSRQAARKKGDGAVAHINVATKVNQCKKAEVSSPRGLVHVPAPADDPERSLDERRRAKLLLARSIEIMELSKTSLSASDFLSDRSLIPLACCEDPGSRELLTKYAWFKRRMYPIESCVDFAMDEGCWAGCFAYDAGFVHAILFTGAAMEDFVLRRGFSRATSQHLQQTIKRLKNMISNDTSVATTATFTIVLSLCMVASMYGDGDALTIHLAGLKRMANMCVPDAQFLMEPMIQFKLRALELAAYMCTGSTQMLGHSASWSSVYSPSKPIAHAEMPGYDEIKRSLHERRLLYAFEDLRSFCDRLNASSLSGERLQGTTYQRTITSIQTRLVHLEGVFPDSLQECIRLSMVAFLSTNIRVPTRRLHCAYLRSKLTVVSDSLVPLSEEQVEVRLWIIMISAMSIFEPEEDWITDQWRRYASPQLSWNDLKEILKGILWVDCMHDDVGRQTFEVLQKVAK